MLSVDALQSPFPGLGILGIFLFLADHPLRGGIGRAGRPIETPLDGVVSIGRRRQAIAAHTYMMLGCHGTGGEMADGFPSWELCCCLLRMVVGLVRPSQ